MHVCICPFIWNVMQTHNHICIYSMSGLDHAHTCVIMHCGYSTNQSTPSHPISSMHIIHATVFKSTHAQWCTCICSAHVMLYENVCACVCYSYIVVLYVIMWALYSIIWFAVLTHAIHVCALSCWYSKGWMGQHCDIVLVVMGVHNHAGILNMWTHMWHNDCLSIEHVHAHVLLQCCMHWIMYVVVCVRTIVHTSVCVCGL